MLDGAWENFSKEWLERILNETCIKSHPELQDKFDVIIFANDSILERADVVIIHPAFTDLQTQNTVQFENLKKNRKPYQIITYFQKEGPYFHKIHRNYTRFNNFFNATVTFRTDSTFPHYYGKASSGYDNRKMSVELLKKSRSETVRISDYKPFGVLIAFSNCHSIKRLNTVKRLNDLLYLPENIPALDVFGECQKEVVNISDYSFDRIMAQNNSKEIINLVLNGTEESNVRLNIDFKKYRFYLSFENSECKDYITEKFFKNALENELVPIAMGGLSRKDYEKHIPRDAFIHVNDYGGIESEIGIKRLSKHINYLLRNDTAYLEYFKWKERDISDYERKSDGFCDLFSQALKIRNGQNIKFPVYKDFEKWWFGDETDPICKDNKFYKPDK